MIECSICALCYYEVFNFTGQILQENFNSALDSNFQSCDLKVWAKLLKIIDPFVESAPKSKDLIKFIITKLAIDHFFVVVIRIANFTLGKSFFIMHRFNMYFKDSVWFLISLPSFMYCMIMFMKGFFFCLNSMNFVGMIVQRTLGTKRKAWPDFFLKRDDKKIVNSLSNGKDKSLQTYFGILWSLLSLMIGLFVLISLKSASDIK